MKCPMCGSDNVTVSITSLFQWVDVRKEWELTEPCEVCDESPVECECGWRGQVSELERTKE